jgi:type IV secretion system protein VirB10
MTHMGRHLNRRKIVGVGVGVLGLIAGVGYVASQWGQEASTTPVTTAQVAAESTPPSADLTHAALQAYVLKADVETPRLTPVVTAAPSVDLTPLQNEIADLRRQLDETKRQPKSTTPTASTPNADAQRSAQEAREQAKAAAAALKASREAPLAMIRHDSAEETKRRLTVATSKAWLAPGTVIGCVLDAGINSEHQAPVVARVSQTIYDSVTGQVPVIPQDALLIGQYRSTAFGDDTADVSWNTLTYGNRVIDLQGQPGGDGTGQAGLEGEVDNKWGKVIASLVVGSVFRASGSAVAFAGSDSTAERAGAMAAQSAIQDGQRSVMRTMNVTPTIHVAPGTPCSLTLKTPLDLAGGR